MSTRIARHTLSSHRTRITSHLHPTDLNSVDFAPFGEVVQNPTAHGGEPKLESVSANQGSATKWLDVSHMTDFYGLSGSRKTARVVMNLFTCQPRELVESRDGSVVFPVKILERHPFTAQTFVPIGISAEEKNVRYLVIVAPTLPTSSSSDQSSDSSRKGPGMPDLDNIKAFIAKGDQAVTYGAGTWHAPMVVLGEKPIDFVVVQYSNGVATDDCQESYIETNAGNDELAVDLSGVGRLRAKL